jgi:GNAT superfamily N-acetyltransferase
MQVLRRKKDWAEGVAPAVQSICHGERLLTAPRYVLDHVLLWHAQLRLWGVTDVGLLTGEEELVWAEGWYEMAHHLHPPVLGVLLWTPQEDGSWNTELGFVTPSYRKQGIYELMWDCVVHKAREAGVKYIEGGTTIDNDGMRAVMEKLGRKATHVIYGFEVNGG